MPEQKRAKRFHVAGRVQGVGYRYFVHRAAERHGLVGYVRNLRDGRVEVYAVGTEAQLRALLGELWRGPSHAAVENVGETDSELITAFASGFSIETED